MTVNAAECGEHTSTSQTNEHNFSNILYGCWGLVDSRRVPVSAGESLKTKEFARSGLESEDSPGEVVHEDLVGIDLGTAGTKAR